MVDHVPQQDDPTPAAPTRAANHLDPDSRARRVIRRAAVEPPGSTIVVGAASDPEEAAADRLADAVMRQLSVRPPTDASSSGRIRRSSAMPVSDAAGPDGGVLDGQTASRIRRASGAGQPLDGGLRPRLESAFGSDFGKVRIHPSSDLAPTVGALAFTHGTDIHFAPGQYDPTSVAGQRVISHELAHVVQQRGAPPLSRLHRLMDAEKFKKMSNAGALRVRGKTVKEIDSLLIQYDALKARGDQFNIGKNGIDRAIGILTHIREDIALWRRSHAQDTGRSGQRAALDQLDNEAAAEMNELINVRAAFVQHGVQAQPLEVKDNVFKQKMEGSASSVLDKLAPIIRVLIPAPGDAASLEASVKIPIDPDAAGYVGFRLTFGLERMDNSTTKISLEAAVTGGVRVIGMVDVGLELGAFIEAQGRDPKAALQMLSWGWYRRIRESLLPREVANFMWGGSTGSVGWVRAEDWAASVERENFKADDKDLSSGVGSDSTTNAYVRTGGFGSATGSATIAKLVEVEGSARFGGGTHYDKDTITARKERRGGEFGQAEAMPTRGKTTYLGTRFLKAELSASAGVGPFSGSLDGSLEWLTDQQTKRMRLEYLSGSLSASATVPLTGSVIDEIVSGAISLGPQVISLVKRLVAVARGKEKGVTAADGVGEVTTTAESAAHALASITGEEFDMLDFDAGDSEPMSSLSDQLKTGPSINADETAATLTLAIAFGKNLWDRSSPVAVDLTLGSERAIQLDASIASVKASRSRRLLRLRWTAGKWKPKVD